MERDSLCVFVAVLVCLCGVNENVHDVTWCDVCVRRDVLRKLQRALFSWRGVCVVWFVAV